MALALLKYRIGNYFYAPRFQPRLGHVTMNRPALPAFESSMVKGAIKISLNQDQPFQESSFAKFAAKNGAHERLAMRGQDARLIRKARRGNFD
jgi:hypothetical protein